MRLSNGNSIKTDGNHQSSLTAVSTAGWGGRERDLILLFFSGLFVSVCVCALFISKIWFLLWFFCSLCVCWVGACYLSVCHPSLSSSAVLLYANVSRAWWGVILFALHRVFDRYILDRHVSIKDTQVPPSFIDGFSSFLFRFDLGPSPAQVKSVSLIFSTDPN